MRLTPRYWLTAGASVTAAALLTACSSSSSPTQASSSPASSAPASATASLPSSASASATSPAAAGLALARQTVTQLEATTSSYPVPSASVPGVAKLKGKTVYYIPIIQQVPTFAVAAQAMK